MNILSNPDVFPGEEVLKEILSEESFYVYIKLMNSLNNSPDGNHATLKDGLIYEWRYYNDGKSWLCKVANKKRTIFWLSVWEGYFKVSFYFTEKHKQGICDLAISDVIKQQFLSAKPVGKLIPLTIDINSIKQLPDLIEIINLRIG